MIASVLVVPLDRLSWSSSHLEQALHSSTPRFLRVKASGLWTGKRYREGGARSSVRWVSRGPPKRQANPYFGLARHLWAVPDLARTNGGWSS